MLDRYRTRPVWIRRKYQHLLGNNIGCFFAILPRYIAVGQHAHMRGVDPIRQHTFFLQRTAEIYRMIPSPEISKITMLVLTLRVELYPGILLTGPPDSEHSRDPAAKCDRRFFQRDNPCRRDTPAWRMPPPSRLRINARAQSPLAFQLADFPTGAPSPFDRQNITESTSRVMRATVVAVASAALKIRAPSICTFQAARMRLCTNSSIVSCGYTVPPDMLCVFSSVINVVGALCGPFGRRQWQSAST